jgi:hypothetical protein
MLRTSQQEEEGESEHVDLCPDFCTHFNSLDGRAEYETRGIKEFVDTQIFKKA